MSKLISLAFIALMILFGGCSDFLEEYPADQTYISSISDLDELLVGEGYMASPKGTESVLTFINTMDDDVVLSILSNSFISYEIDGKWSFWFWNGLPNTETLWNTLYRHISVLNVILDHVENFTGEKDYARVKGEAAFLRAAYYYFLVNLFGKPYSVSATTDLGVPIKTSARIEDKNYERNTVAECYQQIVADLQTAVICLQGETPTNKFRAGEMAVRAFLGRVYLYLGEYNKVIAQCDTIITKGGYQLLDYNELEVPTENQKLLYPNVRAKETTETIFTCGSNTTHLNSMWGFEGSAYGNLAVNPKFVASYTDNDLRCPYFFRGLTSSISSYIPAKMGNHDEGVASDYFLLHIAEVYLNKAEAEAMSDQPQAAIATLKMLQKKRYAEGHAPEITVSGEELVNIIRQERRWELCFEGHRWFDLRRYAVAEKYPFQTEIVHSIYDYFMNNISESIALGTYDLEPQYYVLPIPISEFESNKGTMVQNEERKNKYVME